MLLGMSKMKDWTAEQKIKAISAVLKLPVPWYVTLFLIVEIIEHGQVISKGLFK